MNKSWDVRLDSQKNGVSFFSCPHSGSGNILEVSLAVRTVAEENILEVFFSCPHGGRGKCFGRTYRGKNDQPLFKESLQTSQGSFESDSDFKKSRDVCPDSSKSGWLFLSCPAGGRGKYFAGVF